MRLYPVQMRNFSGRKKNNNIFKQARCCAVGAADRGDGRLI